MILWCWGAFASAAELQYVEVDHQVDRYFVKLSVKQQVKADLAYRLFTDYSNLQSINPSVKNAQVVEIIDSKSTKLASVIEVCILWMCKDIEQLQIMQMMPPDVVRARMITEGSDFHYGIAQWRLTDCSAEESCFEFEAELEPKFWAPPIIGTFLVKRMFAKEAINTAKGMEKLASENHLPNN